MVKKMIFHSLRVAVIYGILLFLAGQPFFFDKGFDPQNVWHLLLVAGLILYRFAFFVIMPAVLVWTCIMKRANFGDT